MFSPRSYTTSVFGCDRRPVSEFAVGKGDTAFLIPQFMSSRSDQFYFVEASDPGTDWHELHAGRPPGSGLPRLGSRWTQINRFQLAWGRSALSPSPARTLLRGQLRRGRRVRPPRERDGGHGRRPERRPGVTALRRSDAALRQRHAALRLFVARRTQGTCRAQIPPRQMTSWWHVGC